MWAIKYVKLTITPFFRKIWGYFNGFIINNLDLNTNNKGIFNDLKFDIISDFILFIFYIFHKIFNLKSKIKLYGQKI